MGIYNKIYLLINYSAYSLFLLLIVLEAKCICNMRHKGRGHNVGLR